MDVTVKIWSTEAHAMALNIIISYHAVWRESYYYTTRVFAFGGDMSTSTWNEYNHLEAHGLDEKTCQGLFSDQCSWSLSRKPTVGFYLELMTYKRNHFPTLTNREMGKLLLKVDPWLSLDTKYPQNAYLKIMKLNNRKRKIDHTEMVSYGAAKRPKETTSPQQVPESPSTSTALYYWILNLLQ